MANTKLQLEIIHYYWEHVVTKHDSINDDIVNVYFLIHGISRTPVPHLRNLHHLYAQYK